MSPFQLNFLRYSQENLPIIPVHRVLQERMNIPVEGPTNFKERTIDFKQESTYCKEQFSDSGQSPVLTSSDGLVDQPCHPTLKEYKYFTKP